MKKLNSLLLPLLFIPLISCGDKDQNTPDFSRWQGANITSIDDVEQKNVLNCRKVDEFMANSHTYYSVFAPVHLEIPSQGTQENVLFNLSSHKRNVSGNSSISDGGVSMYVDMIVDKSNFSHRVTLIANESTVASLQSNIIQQTEAAFFYKDIEVGDTLFDISLQSNKFSNVRNLVDFFIPGLAPTQDLECQPEGVLSTE